MIPTSPPRRGAVGWRLGNRTINDNDRKPEVTRGPAKLLMAMLLAACVGCTTKPNEQPVSDSLTPEQAKAALLAMMRSPGGQEVLWFRGEAPDAMAKLSVTVEEDGWCSWSSYRFNT